MPFTSKLTSVSPCAAAGAVLEVLLSLVAVSVPLHPETAIAAVASTATAKKLKYLMVFSTKKKIAGPRKSSTLEKQH
jgi:hypothetical protein